MGKLTTHFHIYTKHKLHTPDYPSPDAVYIYTTGCAKALTSVQQKDKTFELQQIASVANKGIDVITCRPCKVWASAYMSQNINNNGDYVYNEATK